MSGSNKEILEVVFFRVMHSVEYFFAWEQIVPSKVERGRGGGETKEKEDHCHAIYKRREARITQKMCNRFYATPGIINSISPFNTITSQSVSFDVSFSNLYGFGQF